MAQSFFHDLSEEEWGALLASWGEPRFRLSQLFTWVYQKREAQWESMTSLSKGLREKLSQAAQLCSLREKAVEHSSDGQTLKFLWELSDGKRVESVLIYAPDR